MSEASIDPTTPIEQAAEDVRALLDRPGLTRIVHVAEQAAGELERSGRGGDQWKTS